MDRLISVERHERILRRFAELLECSGKTEAAEAVNTIIKGLKLEPTASPCPEAPKVNEQSCTNCANDGMDIPQCKECPELGFAWYREKV